MRFPAALALAASGATAGAQNSTGTADPFVKYNISAPGIQASFIPYGARLTNLFGIPIFYLIRRPIVLYLRRLK
jgi:aldose 1-epimerase